MISIIKVAKKMPLPLENLLAAKASFTRERERVFEASQEEVCFFE